MPKFGTTRALTISVSSSRKTYLLKVLRGKSSRRLKIERRSHSQEDKNTWHSNGNKYFESPEKTNRLRDAFIKCSQEEKSLSGNISRRMKKIPNEKVDSELLESLVHVVGEYEQTKPHPSMTEVAMTIRAVQMVYELESIKHRIPSIWKGSIIKKILTLKL